MSRKHQEYSGFATGLGQMAGCFLVILIGLLALAGAIEVGRYLVTLINLG